MNGVQLTSWQALRAGIVSTTKAMLKWLVTNPAGWAIIAATSFAALVKVVDELGVTVEEQREELKNLKQEYSEITSELKALNSELSTTEQRMKELEKIETPTFAEKEEYDNLVKTNNELQRKIDLLELEEKIKSQEARDAFVSTMKKDTDRTKDKSDEYFYYVDPDDIYQQKNLGKGSTVPYLIGGFSIQAIPEDELVDIYENYANQLRELDERYANDLENEVYNETRETLESEMEDLEKYLADKSTQWSLDTDGIKYIDNPTTEDDKAVNEWLDYIADFQDRMAIAMSGDDAKTNSFNRVVDNWQFDGTVQELQDLGKQGQVTADMLNSPKYDEFIDKLVFLGVIDSAENLEDIALAFNSIAESADNASDAADDYDDLWDFSETMSQLDEAKSKLSVLDETFSKLFDKDEDTNISFEDYSAIFEAFKDVEGLDIGGFVQQLQDAGQDVEKVTATMQDLIASYLEHSQILNNVTTDNKDFVITMLEEMGVMNAEEIVLANLNLQHETLAAEKQWASETTRELTDATAEEIQAFIDEHGYSQEVRNELVRLALAKETVNGTVLDFSGDISNIMSYVEILNGATNALNTLNYLKANNGHIPTPELKKLEEEAKREVQNALKKANSYNTAQNIKINTPKYQGGSSTQKAIKDAAEEAKKAAESVQEQFEETFDFFDRRVKVLDDSIDLLSAHLENVVGAFAKNNLIDAQIGVNAEKINNYTDALAMYTQKANEALSKLPSDIAQKIKDGAIDLTTFIGDGNQEVVEAVKDYEQWADKMADCKQQLAELKEAIRDLELEKFNNIMEDFANQFDLREDSKDLISKQIDLLKEAGQLIGESFYSSQIEQTKKQLALLEEEKAQLTKQLTSALSSGRIEVGTDEWLEMVNSLSDVESSILDAKTALEEFDNSLLELHTEVFNRIQDQFGNFHSELSNLGGLFEDFDVSDKNGMWSKEGLARLGLLAQQYELAKYQVAQYDEEIALLNQQYLEGRYSTTEYADKLAELSNNQWEAVNSSEDLKDAIVELNEARINESISSIEEEVDAYKELIDAKIEALEAEKDLHNYRLSISEKTKSVTDLERQIAAMQNDDTASTVAKRKQLEEQLAEARKDLEETEYNHSVDSQIDALNKQYENFEKEKNDEIELLKASLENQEQLITESFETIKQNANIIGEQITQIAQQHGVYVSDALTTSWQQGENAIASYGVVLSEQSSAFIGNIIGVENQVWDLQAQANTTADSLAWMFSTRADNLVNELANSYYSEANLNSMTHALQDSLINTLERGYNVSSITSALDSIADGARAVASAAAEATQRLAEMGVAQNSNQQSGYTYKYYQDAGKEYDSNKNLVRVYDENDKLIAVTTLGVAQYKYHATNKYATGVKDLDKDELAWTQEYGREVILSPSRNAILTPLKEGDSVLTKLQTDNLYEWSKLKPVNNMSSVINNTIPNINKNENNTPSLHLDKLVEINGSVGSSVDLKQVEIIANKAVDNLVNKMYDGVKYRGY